MLVVCVNDPLCAVICAVYDTGVVVVVTVLVVDPPPPPQPTIIPTNRSEQTPMAIRTRSSVLLADHARKTKIIRQKDAAIIPGPNPRAIPGETKTDQPDSFSCRNAALTTPNVTVVLPDALIVDGEIAHVIAVGTTQDKVTVPENEFTGAMVSLLLVEVVPLMVTAVGLAVS
jgi:hypothetical protein